MIDINNTETGYDKALQLASSHYENFPVVSILVPKQLRKHVAIVYWFARIADDIADEGNSSHEEKLKELEAFEERLTSLLNLSFENELEKALYNTISTLNLDSTLFYDLLKAFKQDTVKNRYDTYLELLDYCKNSANPVGRIILQLFNIRDEKAYYYSDCICTGLQLTNFWQDIIVDYAKNRIYIPQEFLNSHNIIENIIKNKEINSNFVSLLKELIQRTELLFDEGTRLLAYLPFRLKMEIKLTILGGRTILNKIKKQNFNIYKPVKLKKIDLAGILLKSIILD